MRASELDEQVSDLIHEGIRAAADGQFEQTFKAIASIDVVRLRQQRNTLRAQFKAILPGDDSNLFDESMGGTNAPLVTNNSYFCEYCGKRTIEAQVLKLFSSAFPGILPWESNWKYAHVIYWTHSASVEHHIPRARGGDPGRGNCIRTCYQCNDLKRHRLISELGWRIFEPTEGTQPWDGLASYFSKLESALSDVHKVKVLPEWMRSQVAHLTLRPLASRNLPLASPSKAANRRPRTANTHTVLSAPEMQEGYFVRAQLPGKNSRRSYRVLGIQNDQITLNEMWRENGSIWVASRTFVTLQVMELSQIEIVSEQAPMPGSKYLQQ